MRMASHMMASVIGLCNGKPINLPDTATLVACNTEKEAHYVCAVASSSPFDLAAQSYSQRGDKSFASRHILENIRAPKLNHEDEVHVQLASLSHQAHKARAKSDKDTIGSVEALIDALAAKMWGLTKAELKEMQESLAELGR